MEDKTSQMKRSIAAGKLALAILIIIAVSLLGWAALLLMFGVW